MGLGGLEGLSPCLNVELVKKYLWMSLRSPSVISFM